MWGCEWDKIKKGLHNKAELDEMAKQQTVNVRHALLGGRTEAFKTYHKTTGRQQIHYRDVVSLYPTVNAMDDYAVDYADYVKTTPEDIAGVNSSAWRSWT